MRQWRPDCGNPTKCICWSTSRLIFAEPRPPRSDADTVGVYDAKTHLSRGGLRRDLPPCVGITTEAGAKATAAMPPRSSSNSPGAVASLGAAAMQLHGLRCRFRASATDGPLPDLVLLSPEDVPSGVVSAAARVHKIGSRSVRGSCACRGAKGWANSSRRGGQPAGSRHHRVRCPPRRLGRAPPVHRQSLPSGYWSTPGSSGSPVFAAMAASSWPASSASRARRPARRLSSCRDRRSAGYRRRACGAARHAARQGIDPELACRPVLRRHRRRPPFRSPRSLSPQAVRSTHRDLARPSRFSLRTMAPTSRPRSALRARSCASSMRPALWRCCGLKITEEMKRVRAGFCLC